MDRNLQFAACVGALHLHANDNVAVAMADINPGPINIFGATDNPSFIAKQTIERGHKVALRPINRAC
jgi:hypothetical protein